MGDLGSEETAEFRTLDAPTQPLPAVVPAMAPAPTDPSADEPGIDRRWRWPLLALAAAALASVPVALFATSDEPARHQQAPPLRWPPAAQAASQSPSPTPPPADGGPLEPPPGPPPQQAAPPRVSAPASPSPSPTALSYEAEAPGNRLSGQAAPRDVPGASGGRVVGWVGGRRENTLTFTRVTAATAGRYELTVYYVSNEHRAAAIAVNDRFAGLVEFPPTGGWHTVGSVKVTLTLRAGANEVEFGNRYSWAPDFDRIVLPG